MCNEETLNKALLRADAQFIQPQYNSCLIAKYYYSFITKKQDCHTPKGQPSKAVGNYKQHYGQHSAKAAYQMQSQKTENKRQPISPVGNMPT